MNTNTSTNNLTNNKEPARVQDEHATTMTAMALPTKEEEAVGECPICLEELPKDTAEFSRWACCGVVVMAFTTIVSKTCRV